MRQRPRGPSPESEPAETPSPESESIDAGDSYLKAWRAAMDEADSKLLVGPPGSTVSFVISSSSGLSRTTSSHGCGLQCMPQETEITAEVYSIASPGSLLCDTAQILRSTLLTFLFCKCTRALTFENLWQPVVQSSMSLEHSDFFAAWHGRMRDAQERAEELEAELRDSADKTLQHQEAEKDMREAEERKMSELETRLQHAEQQLTNLQVTLAGREQVLTSKDTEIAHLKSRLNQVVLEQANRRINEFEDEFEDEVLEQTNRRINGLEQANRRINELEDELATRQMSLSTVSEHLLEYANIVAYLLRDINLATEDIEILISQQKILQQNDEERDVQPIISQQDDENKEVEVFKTLHEQLLASAYVCAHCCKFVGGYAQVEAHELECAEKTPPPHAAPETLSQTARSLEGEQGEKKRALKLPLQPMRVLQHVARESDATLQGVTLSEGGIPSVPPTMLQTPLQIQRALQTIPSDTSYYYPTAVQTNLHTPLQTPRSNASNHSLITLTRGLNGMVGITFCKAAQSGPYTVMEVSSQGAAHRSGLLKSGDLIQSIDQQSVYNLDSRQVSKLLVGPPGSTVSLVISSQWAEA